MKFAYVFQSFVALSVASPAPAKRSQAPEGVYDISALGLVRDELLDGSGACPKAIFIFARGTMELDNMGLLVGPAVADGLESILGADNIWIQGVGGQYAANVEGNFYTDGAPPEAIAEMSTLLELADSKCPNAKIVAGGYSQGAALVAAAIRDTKASIRNKIVGTALFGYSKNQQNNGQVQNYPSDRLRVYCNEGDMICEGTLIVLPVHLDYEESASGPAPKFLAGQINA